MALPSRQVAAADCQLNWQVVNQYLIVGDGDPTGAVAAPRGALFLRRDGGAGEALYVMESGGWVPK